MNIIEFIEDKNLINDQFLSPAQKMSLKAVYGLPLTKEELQIFKQCTGLSRYVPKERNEVTFCCGRRAGKSDKLASNIALYEACARKHELSVGEIGIVAVIASEKKRQARICHNYILGKLEQSRVLSRLIKKVTTEEIALTNGVAIQVYPCSAARVRGGSLIAFIGDEVSFWKHEGVDIDKDVLDGARPGLSFPYSKMIKISTPYMMRGEIYQDFKQYWAKEDADVLVFQGPSMLFNPALQKAWVTRLQNRDPVAYRTEVLAEFRADLSGMYDPDVIDAAVNPDRPVELSPRNDVEEYVAFVDVAGGGGKDSYALAVGHLENGKIMIDAVRSRAPKFNPEEVTAQYCELLKQYRVYKVYGDKFSGDWALHSFAKHSLRYERSEKSKSELYLESESPFNTGQVELPDKALLKEQLKNLVRKTVSGGKDKVDTDAGQPEDEANVVAGAIHYLSKKENYVKPEVWILQGDDPPDVKPWEADMIRQRESGKPGYQDDPEIEAFTTEENIKRYIGLSRKHKRLNAMAKEMGVEPEFLRSWVTRKRDQIDAFNRGDL